MKYHVKAFHFTQIMFQTFDNLFIWEFKIYLSGEITASPVTEWYEIMALALIHVSLVEQIMWCNRSLSASLMLSVSGLTSTSWVIAVSSDHGEIGGGGQHTQHIHNE